MELSDIPPTAGRLEELPTLRVEQQAVQQPFQMGLSIPHFYKGIQETPQQTR
jgi:hypothetical protein